LYVGYINGKQYCGYNGHRAYVRKNSLKNSMIEFLTENLRYDRSLYRVDNERRVKNQIKNIFDELVELGIIEIREV
jgi:ribulose 1,5-bisphosphate synthetase/thiazole synthase